MGVGGRINPDRKEALDLVETAATLESVYQEIISITGEPPLALATSAIGTDDCVRWHDARKMLEESGVGSILLIFGTASGLAPEILRTCDGILCPIKGNSAYNHLSVRSAVAIALDRLLGDRY